MRRYVFSFFACLLVLFWAVFPVCHGQAEATEVRIGLIEEPSYAYVDSHGNYRGYNAELMLEIGQYANMDFRFIMYKNPGEVLAALEKGDIDILPDFIRTEERERKYLFSEYPFITQSSVIYGRADDPRYAYGDTSQLKGMKFGLLKGSLVVSLFEKWCGLNGFSPRIETFPSELEIKKALDEGRIDATVLSNFIDGCRALLYFMPTTSHIMFRKDSLALKAQIDAAMGLLLVEDPLYVNTLFAKYLRAYTNAAPLFTSEEKAYIASHPKLRVAMVDGDLPFVSPGGDVEKGIIHDYFLVLAAKTGLHFDFVRYASFADAVAGVSSGGADILGIYNGDLVLSSALNLSRTSPYGTFSCVRLTRAGKEGPIRKVAVLDRTAPVLSLELVNSKEASELTHFPGILAAYRALENDAVDAIYCSMPLATWLINQHGVNRFNVSPMPTLYLEMSGAIARNNPVLHSILDRAIKTSGPEFQSVVTSNTVAENSMDALIARIPPARILIFFLLMSGLVTGLVLALFALRRRQKEHLAVIAARMDNERRETQLAEAAKANAEKDHFFSTMGHDMRTPLNAIIGLADLVNKEEVSPKVGDYLARIQIAGRLLLDLINDTLLISRLSTGRLALRPEPVEAEDLLESIVVTIREEASRKNVAFEPQYTGVRGCWILADRLNVGKIVLNLLSNAVRYTPSGGKVEFLVRMEPHPQGRTGALMVIRDTGVGISKEFLPQIFKPFVQEQKAGYEGTGTGLGLHIVKRLVDLMGGSIKVESVDGRGTTVTLQLSFEVAEARIRSVAPALTDTRLLVGRHVLLIEDNPTNSLIAVALLEKVGMHVSCAQNGKEGVDMFASSPCHGFDAILADLRMPVMDGCTAASAIRALDRPDAATIPIIAVSADTLDEERNRCLRAGMNGYIAKPYQPDEVYRLLIEVLSASGACRDTISH